MQCGIIIDRGMGFGKFVEANGHCFFLVWLKSTMVYIYIYQWGKANETTITMGDEMRFCFWVFSCLCFFWALRSTPVDLHPC